MYVSQSLPLLESDSSTVGLRVRMEQRGWNSVYGVSTSEKSWAMSQYMSLVNAMLPRYILEIVLWCDTSLKWFEDDTLGKRGTGIRMGSNSQFHKVGLSILTALKSRRWNCVPASCRRGVPGFTKRMEVPELSSRTSEVLKSSNLV